jgi:hypothetical protein
MYTWKVHNWSVKLKDGASFLSIFLGKKTLHDVFFVEIKGTNRQEEGHICGIHRTVC